MEQLFAQNLENLLNNIGIPLYMNDLGVSIKKRSTCSLLKMGGRI